MSRKIKTNQLKTLGLPVGLIMMSLAATLSIAELPDHLTSQLRLNKSFGFALVSSTNLANNSLRREKDEASPQYISYAISQRTPGRMRNS